MNDIIEREVKSNRAWREECESLRQQVRELTELLDYVKSEREQQLAKCQAREKVLRNALDSFYVNDLQFSNVWGSSKTPKEIDEALTIPSDSTALDTMLKQAKRHALLEAIEMAKRYEWDSCYVRELEKMAKELE
jgi:hypothetical protein